RGDVVVFRYPLDVSVLYVKRTIGAPGDVVSYDHGVVRVNDEPFDASLDKAYADVRPEDRGQVFVRESEAGREHTIKLDAMRPGAMVPPQAWVDASPDACKVVSSQQWQCKVPAGKYL